MSYIVQDLPHFSDVIWVVCFVREVVYIEHSHQKWSSASTWDSASALQWVEHDICQKWKGGSLKDIWKMFCFLALFCIRQVEMLFVISASKVVILLTQPLPSFTRPQPSLERIPLPPPPLISRAWEAIVSVSGNVATLGNSWKWE